MLINVVALEMLKAKMPQFSSRWLLFKRTHSLCPQPLSRSCPLSGKRLQNLADAVASQAPSLTQCIIVGTAEMTIALPSHHSTSLSSPDDSPSFANFSHLANLSNGGESKGVPGVPQTKVHSASSDEVSGRLFTHVTTSFSSTTA